MQAQSVDLHKKIKDVNQKEQEERKQEQLQAEVDFSKTVQSTELSNKSFNEVDYAAILMNTNVRIAVRNVAKGLTFENQIITALKKLILEDTSGSTQKIISQLYVLYPQSNFDTLKEKLDYYANIKDRETINHYLKLVNNRIKKSVINSSLTKYFDDKDMEGLIDTVDVLSGNITNSVIPFTALSDVSLDDIKESFADENKLLSSLKKINQLSNYKALLKGQLVVVAAPPGTGKSQLLINETYHHAKNGYKVVYLAMGDSLLSDFTIKLGCIHFGIDIDTFLDNIERLIDDEGFKKVLANIKLAVVSAGEINSSDARKVFLADDELNTADVYVFDYDSNFQELSEIDMYKAHDRIYNNIYALARSTPPKLVYVASQLKTAYYNTEYVPLDGLAESNRKQAIADYIIMISGIRGEDMNCGIINVVKNRRGKLGFTAYTLDVSGRFKEISLQEYRNIKSQIIDKEDTTGVNREESDYGF